MAGAPAGDLARKLGIRTGRVAVPCGLLAIVAGAVLFLLPPHSAIAAIVLGVLGAGTCGLGAARLAGGPWWALLAATIAGGLLFAALAVAGRGLLLHAFGGTETCDVVRRQEVDTRSRYQHYGFVHTLACPRAGTLTIRTDSTDRQPQGAHVAVLDDPGGLLEPDFASRHNLAVEVVAILAAVALAGGTVRLTWHRAAVRSAS